MNKGIHCSIICNSDQLELINEDIVGLLTREWWINTGIDKGMED